MAGLGTRIARIFVRKDDPGSGRKQTVDGMQVVTLPPEWVDVLRMYGGMTSLGAVYRKQSAVHSVVNFLARNVSQLNLKVYERVSADDRLELDEHPMAIILHRPNTRLTRERLLFGTVADMHIYDRAHWLKIRDGQRVIGIRRLPPNALWPEYDSGTGALLGYRTIRNQLLDERNLVTFHGYAPESEEGFTPPLEALRRILAEDFASSRHREYFWRNAARQGGIIERPIDAPEWNNETRERFKADWRAVATGAENAGETPVLEDGMKFVEKAFSPRESEYIQGRKLTHEEVTRAFHVHPAIFGIGQISAGNLDEAHKTLYADTFAPILNRIEQEIMLQLKPEFEPFDSRNRVYVEFNLHEKLRGSFIEQMKVATMAVGVPSMTVNEWRARLNMPRLEDSDLDTIVKPMNVIYGGQPSTQVPTEDPGRPALLSVDPNEDLLNQMTNLLKNTFRRQRNAVMSDPKKQWNMDRWNRELATDLYALAAQVAARSNLDDKDWLRDLTYRVAELTNMNTAISLREEDPRDVFDVLENGQAVEIAKITINDIVAKAHHE
jgi:HK97 family phage portal protein